MQQPDTSDNPSPSLTPDVGKSLVSKLNGVIREHYPEGAVDFPQVIQVLLSLAYSYKRVLLYPAARWPETGENALKP